MDPYVNICICITPGADISDDRIAKDLAVAESIWHPITFQIQEVIVLNELFRFLTVKSVIKIPFKVKKSRHPFSKHV